MKNNFILLLILFTSAALFIGFYKYEPDNFLSRFQKGIKITAGEGVIDINFGCLVPAVVDWNNDGKKDLLVGQFDGGMIRLYLNEGTDSAPLFRKYSFIKAGGIDISLPAGWCIGAYPQVVDWNNDGKNDLLVGEMMGKVWIYINTGTKDNPILAKGLMLTADSKDIGSHMEQNQMGESSNPAEDDRDYSKLYSNIQYADWDNDGLKDLIIGSESKVSVYKNIGKKELPKFAKPIALETRIANCPNKSSPAIYDWDKDGKKDLIMSIDKLYFYKNIGSNEKPDYGKREIIKTDDPEFDKQHYKRLLFVDWNNDGKEDLLIGTSYLLGPQQARGNVWLFLGK